MKKKTEPADFPALLVSFIDRDRDGFVSFCYPKLCGYLNSIISFSRVRAADRANVAEIHRQWSAYVDTFAAARKQAREELTCQK